MLVGNMHLIDTDDEPEMSEDERRDRMNDDALDAWDEFGAGDLPELDDNLVYNDEY